jgi:hypothetical protein
MIPEREDLGPVCFARSSAPSARSFTRSAAASSSSVRFADARGRMKRSDDREVAHDAGVFALVPVSLF